MLPGRVRGGPAQPGRRHPVRDPERAGLDPGRADVRGLGRPGGADARARRPAVHPGHPPPGRRLRRARGQLRHRARLHQHAQRAGPGRDAAARRRPAARTTRSCWPAGTRPSTPSRSPTSSTPRCSGDGEEIALAISRGDPGVEGRGSTRAAGTGCCCGWPPAVGSTCPSSTTSTTCRTVGSSGWPRTGPDVPFRVAKHTLMDLDAWPYPKKPLVPLAETVHERYSVEIFRGCTRGCRFCQAGHDHPAGAGAQHRDHRRHGAGRASRRPGWRRSGCSACPAPTTPRSRRVTKQLADRYEGTNVSLSLPSTRVDAFNIDLANELSRNGRRSGLTFAPEGGSERLRKVINKMVSEDDLIAHGGGGVRARLAAGQALLHVRAADRDRRGRAGHRRPGQAGDRRPAGRSAADATSVAR